MVHLLIVLIVKISNSLYIILYKSMSSDRTNPFSRNNLSFFRGIHSTLKSDNASAVAALIFLSSI